MWPFSTKSRSRRSPALPSTTQQELVAVYRQALASGLSLDEVDRKVDHYWQRSQSVVIVEKQTDHDRQTEQIKQIPKVVRITAWLVPVLLLGVGLYLVGSVVVPLASNVLTQAPQFARLNFDSPIPREQVLSVVPTVIAEAPSNPSQVNGVTSQPKILDVELDYSNLANWFSDPIPELANASGGEVTYYLDIPKLKVEKAEVKIGGTNLSESLIQYPGTADPGNLGAPVIFGHSVLRQFYNPSLKNPRRYMSIFSYIMTLEPGDEIFVTHQGVKYRYLVKDKTDVKPEDTYILSQQFESKTLKLVTCRPEGTFLLRGVVTAELAQAKE
jgi:LPXTG-site transpeptidase (sortase) family protein